MVRKASRLNARKSGVPKEFNRNASLNTEKVLDSTVVDAKHYAINPRRGHVWYGDIKSAYHWGLPVRSLSRRSLGLCKSYIWIRYEGVSSRISTNCKAYWIIYKKCLLTALERAAGTSVQTEMTNRCLYLPLMDLMAPNLIVTYRWKNDDSCLDVNTSKKGRTLYRLLFRDARHRISDGMHTALESLCYHDSVVV